MVLSKNTIEITQDFDADNDFIDDLWERKYGLNPNNSNDSLLDNDNDGQNNLDEFISGTDPNDINSNFRILSISTTKEGKTSIKWKTVKGRNYKIISSTKLKSSDNKELHKVIGNGEIMEFIDRNSTQSEKNFYRIEASKDQ